MSLIVCPECHNKISDKANICIHCGYPLSDFTTKKSYNVIFQGFLSINNRLKCIGLIRQILRSDLGTISQMFNSKPSILLKNLTQDNAEYIANTLRNLDCTMSVEETNDVINAEINSIIDDMKNGIVICPKCYSKNISTNRKGFTLTTGFIGSNKTVNRCANCGYSWKP